jgi:FAD/FMN-containing dehydrogenase
MVNFQQFSMDESTGHASIGSGTLLGDVTERLHDAGGRAIAHGTCPQVGIGGHATIGGLGPISRQWGTALDHVIEAEVVLANGTILRTNSVNHPEVLWGLKGAASSLGVITEFVVYTHEEPKEITKYSYNLEFGNSKDAANTFKLWQKMMAAPDLPRQLASQAIAFEFGLIVQGTWFGPQSEFDAFDFDGKLGKTASSIITLDNWLGAVSNWAEKEAIKMAGGMPGAFYSKSLTFRNDTLIPDNTIDSLFELFDTADKGTPIWFVIADLAGGAVNDIPMDGTAYAHRDVLFYIQTYAFGIGSLPDSSRTFLTDINNMIEAALPNVKFGAYAGYVDPAITNGQERYWASNLPQLEQLKGQLDPTDSFHNPQSVRASS